MTFYEPQLFCTSMCAMVQMDTTIGNGRGASYKDNLFKKGIEIPAMCGCSAWSDNSNLTKILRKDHVDQFGCDGTDAKKNPPGGASQCSSLVANTVGMTKKCTAVCQAM